MQYKHGNTLCISTQVGCRMGCNFCASTIDGLVRNLNPGEMLGQVLAVQKEQAGLELKQGQRAVTNIVMMGSGEPLDNYDNVLKFFELINSKEGINISLRNISLSTCGLVEEMKRLADSGYAPTLSISLHAPTDQLRKTMMPIANKHSLKEIIEGAQYYIDKTGRRIIFEYALINGINDTPEHAKKLHLLLRGVMCHINLIPLNDVKERDLKGTTYSNARDFCDMLIELNLSATIRREMGNDIEGACGQLRRSIL